MAPRINRPRLQHGITIIEVLIVTTIIGILTAFALAGLRPLRGSFNLNTTTNQIMAALQLAHTRTLSSENDTQHGVHFETDQYVVFKGTTYNPDDSDNEVHTLPSQVELYDINVGGDDVVFDRIEGTTGNAGSVSIRTTNDPVNSQTISILSSGQVGLAGSVNPTDTRVTDTRHLHFDLGWSIQGATTLTLTFSDPPGPDIEENVTMSDHFNSDQTSFDWEGTVDVNGEEQTLRVYTHLLDATNTELSINRDRRFNTKAVTVAIDNQDIVSYEADGTATVGGSGGTMEQQ